MILQPHTRMNSFMGGGTLFTYSLEVFYLPKALGKCTFVIGVIPYIGARRPLVVKNGINRDFEQSFRIE